jgi:hypothetical protein
MTARYKNHVLNEYYIIGGVRNLEHAWNILEWVAKRNGWNWIDVTVISIKD